MSIERELKLSFPPWALRGVKDSPRLRALKQGRARTIKLVSSYYDTRSRRLERAGVALRLRTQGKGWTQTLKSAGSATAALHARSEFDWPVAGSRLELARLATTPFAKLFGDIDVDALQTVLTTRFTRTAFLITHGPLLAEVAVDQGQIEVGSRRAPINELEIELRAGQVTALYDVAMVLAAELPLRPEIASKAERGFALRDRTPLRPLRARAIELDAGMSQGAAAQRIVGECLYLIQANEPGFLARGDVEFLHQMRVGLRRMRVALACFRDLLEASEAEALKAELRWLGSQLGPARDWDVWCTQTLPAIAAQIGALLPMDMLARDSRVLQRKARATARAAVRSTRYAVLVLRLGRAIAAADAAPLESSAAPVALSRFVARVLNKRRRALLRHVEARPASDVDARPDAQARPVGSGDAPSGNATIPALGAHDPEALHAARIAAKKLRYGVEFFGALHKAKQVRRFARSLSALQDALGTLNDASVAQALLARLAATHPQRYDAATLARIEGWLAGHSAARLEALPAAWRAWRQLDRYW